MCLIIMKFIFFDDKSDELHNILKIIGGGNVSALNYLSYVFDMY